MFMLYDCQPYSANLAQKMLRLMSQVARNKFENSSEKNKVASPQDAFRSQTTYLNSVL